MNEPIELSLEQQFDLLAFKLRVERMSQEQAQTMLIDLYEQMMVREMLYKTLLKKRWSLE